MDITEHLLRHRIIQLGGHLDTEQANEAASRLLLLDSHDHSPIEMHVSWPDSDLDASMSLADTVQVTTAPVYVTVHGMLGGPAIAVVCAGQKRQARSAASFALSLPEASGEGTADELATQARQHEYLSAKLRDIVVDATGRERDDVTSDLRDGRVLSAAEAFEYGLLDDVL